MTLGDLGAEVIKVEAPAGDETRSWGPPYDAAGQSTYHHAANRNKRSVVLDFADADDLELARRLCRRADVVVANFRPGTLERYGLDYEATERANPGVVYCELSGFGEGAGRELVGYDPLAQALGGLMSITGPPEAPSKVGVALVDVIAALYMTSAVLAALHERHTSGRGQRLTTNLLQVTLAALANQATAWLDAGVLPERLGNTHPSIEPFATYAAADGPLMLCVGNERQFEALAEALGRPELAADARFADNAARVLHRLELRNELERLLSGRTAAEWTERLSAVGVPAGPVQSVAEAFALAERLGLDPVDATAGVRTVRFPVRLSRSPAQVRRPPPALGAQSEEIRAWLEAGH
jgi:crotonobetainyl-CoA:carnitine CoA-transferase CaiB-like acyl-CoA transferase